MAATHEDRNAQLSPGVAIKAPCRAATTGAITLSGEQTIDGVACITGDRLLVKNQTDQTTNGIYLVSTGTWTREPDFDGNRDVVLGTVVKVNSGTQFGWWGVTTTNPITFGSSSIAFLQDLASSSSTVSFLPAGAGAVARSVQDINRAIARSGDYDTKAHFQAAIDALTETLAAAILNVGPATGWTNVETLAYYNTAKNFLGARNVGLLGLTQTNYFQFLGHDDNNTVPNVVSTYGAMVDNHPTGTRTSSVGAQFDVLVTGAGTVTGVSGAIGYSEIDAGVVGSMKGAHGQVNAAGGVVTDLAALYAIVQQTAGAVTNSYACLLAGPAKSGGTVTNNYGIYVQRVGTNGSAVNQPAHIVHALGAWSVADAGQMQNPGQPAFLGRKSANTTNATGDGTFYTVIPDVSDFDQASNYNAGTGTFTAPVTGLYSFDAQIQLSNLGAAHTEIDMFLITTGRTFQNVNIVGTRAETQLSRNISVLAKMTVGDTASIQAYVNGSTKTVTVGGGTNGLTYFSGSLVA